MNLAPCLNCDTEYRKDKLKQCPACGTLNEYIGTSTSWSRVDSTPSINTSSSSSKNAESSGFEKLIEAQNRTTHAVRAFVRFLFIQLSGFTAALVVWNWSMSFADQQRCYTSGTNCGGKTFLQIVAVLIWLVAIILSSRAGWSELKKSEVD